ncbi:MAG: aspartate dehydrogenase [Rhizobiaceae bacterium]
MKKPLHIAILGHGTIAKFVWDAFCDSSDVEICAVIAKPSSLEKAKRFSGELCPVIISPKDLPKNVALAVDCSGHGGLIEHGENLLAAGIDVITISTGAVADTQFFDRLVRAAEIGNSRLQFLSGAVGGVDILLAAKTGEINSVTYIGRKPPLGWQGSPAEDRCDLKGLKEAFTHFTGSARQAAIQYPKNANVAATIALAGVGLDETNVKLIADPTITKNCHEVTATGSFGSFQINIESVPLAGNPKSSALAAMSIVQELQRRISNVGF